MRNALLDPALSPIDDVTVSTDLYSDDCVNCCCVEENQGDYSTDDDQTQLPICFALEALDVWLPYFVLVWHWV